MAVILRTLEPYIEIDARLVKLIGPAVALVEPNRQIFGTAMLNGCPYFEILNLELG